MPDLCSKSDFAGKPDLGLRHDEEIIGSTPSNIYGRFRGTGSIKIYFMKLNSTRKLGTLTLALTLGCGAVSAGSSSLLPCYPFAAVTGINSDYLTDNEEAYARLNDLLNALQADFEAVNSEFQVLIPILGNAWGGQFGQQIAAIGQQLNAMRSQLEAQYAAGTLTAESTIDNYDNISGLVAGLKAQFEQTILGNVQSILYDLNMMSAAGLGSIIGDLENELNKYGVAEQFADRIAALYEKKSAAATKVQETTAAIGASTDYVERLATSGNVTAMHVKLNDLTHNLNRGRAGGHWKQVAKHEPALERIQQAIRDGL